MERKLEAVLLARKLFSTQFLMHFDVIFDARLYFLICFDVLFNKISDSFKCNFQRSWHNFRRFLSQYRLFSTEFLIFFWCNFRRFLHDLDTFWRILTLFDSLRRFSTHFDTISTHFDAFQRNFAAISRHNFWYNIRCSSDVFRCNFTYLDRPSTRFSNAFWRSILTLFGGICICFLFDTFDLL